jgi:hypothetical protein
MSLASWFYGKIVPVRDNIAHYTIRVGTILIVYPAKRSKVSKPYKVKVIKVNVDRFFTCMLDGSGHVRYFDFYTEEWKNYHHFRFKIYAY